MTLAAVFRVDREQGERQAIQESEREVVVGPGCSSGGSG